MKEFPCRLGVDMSGMKGLRCKTCENLTGFTMCVRCTGEYCLTSDNKALQYCATSHTVYLAYFPGGIIKVGTTSLYRKEERITEQGAVIGLFIAEGNGKVVRRIESKIQQELDYRSRINRSYKMKNIIVDITENEIISILKNCYTNVLKQLNNLFGSYFQEGQVYSNFKEFLIIKEYARSTNRQLSFEFDIFDSKPDCIEYSSHSNYTVLTGNLLTVIGSLAIMENNQHTNVYDLTALKGYIVN
ncbi:MAG: DUF2797 domain-containing protein [Paenibacillaceae bacterium]